VLSRPSEKNLFIITTGIRACIYVTVCNNGLPADLPVAESLSFRPAINTVMHQCGCGVFSMAHIIVTTYLFIFVLMHCRTCLLHIFIRAVFDGGSGGFDPRKR